MIRHIVYGHITVEHGMSFSSATYFHNINYNSFHPLNTKHQNFVHGTTILKNLLFRQEHYSVKL